MMNPKYHVSVTSAKRVGGRQMIITVRSAIAKFTIKILVTVLIDLFLHTAKQTKTFPESPTTKVMAYKTMKPHSQSSGYT